MRLPRTILVLSFSLVLPVDLLAQTVKVTRGVQQNPFTGQTTLTPAAINPFTGTTATGIGPKQTMVVNPFTGKVAPTGTVNPFTGRTVEGGVYNPLTGGVQTTVNAHNPLVGTLNGNQIAVNPFTGAVKQTVGGYNHFTGQGNVGTTHYNPFTGVEQGYGEYNPWIGQIEGGLASLDCNRWPYGRLARVVQGWYHKYLGRECDLAGLRQWVRVIQIEGVDVALAGILASDEYYRLCGDNIAIYIQSLYIQLLNRKPANWEIKAWYNRLVQEYASDRRLMTIAYIQEARIELANRQ